MVPFTGMSGAPLLVTMRLREWPTVAIINRPESGQAATA
jgi:hypothetical protein